MSSAMIVKLHAVRITALLYLVVPVEIFFLGWLRWEAAITAAALLGFATWRTGQRWRDVPVGEWRVSRGFLVSLVIVGLVWAGLSGVGGWVHQKGDFMFRNAIFHDLINRPWPVLYGP